jgi:hypothetical protein
MDKVQKTSGSQCYIPSSEPFRIHINNRVYNGAEGVYVR